MLDPATAPMSRLYGTNAGKARLLGSAEKRQRSLALR